MPADVHGLIGWRPPGEGFEVSLPGFTPSCRSRRDGGSADRGRAAKAVEAMPAIVGIGSPTRSRTMWRALSPSPIAT